MNLDTTRGTRWTTTNIRREGVIRRGCYTETRWRGCYTENNNTYYLYYILYGAIGDTERGRSYHSIQYMIIQSALLVYYSINV